MAELFLERLNLEQYRHLFVANGVIKTKHLAALTDERLARLGVRGKREDHGWEKNISHLSPRRPNARAWGRACTERTCVSE
jgi:hypothetical protein